MNNFHKRLLFFLFGCILTRFLLVYIVKNLPIKYLPYLGLLGLIPGIGFLVIYFGNYRKTGEETFGEKIWWNNLRPIHSLLYLTFVYLALNKHKNSYIPLLIDVIFGLTVFIIYHYMNNNFSKLLYFK